MRDECHCEPQSGETTLAPAVSSAGVFQMSFARLLRRRKSPPRKDTCFFIQKEEDLCEFSLALTFKNL